MKKMLALLLTLCLLAGMVPLGAGAEEGTSCEGSGACDHEAAIGDTHYVTLQGAIDAATPGETVKLCKISTQVIQLQLEQNLPWIWRVT